jgi:hypothetical protein
MSELTLESVIDKVNQALGTQKDFTPYQAAGVCSRVLGKRVREQMLYNYVAKGYIASTTGVRETNKGQRSVRVIEREALFTWMVRFTTKQLIGS